MLYSQTFYFNGCGAYFLTVHIYPEYTFSGNVSLGDSCEQTTKSTFISLVWLRIRESQQKGMPDPSETQSLYKLLQEFLFASHERQTSVTATTESRKGVEMKEG